MAALVAIGIFLLWMQVISKLPMFSFLQTPETPKEAVKEKAKETTPDEGEEASATSQPTSRPSTSQPGSQPASQPGTLPTMKPEKGKIEAVGLIGDAAGQEQTVRLGSADSKSGYRMEVELTNRGAGVAVARLADYYKAVDRKEHYEIIPASGGVKMAAKSVVVLGKEVPLSDVVWEPGQLAEIEGGQQVSFVTRLKRGEQAILNIAKTFTLQKDSNDLEVSYTLTNVGLDVGDVTIADDGVTTLDQEGSRDDREMVWLGSDKMHRAARLEIVKEADKGKMQPTSGVKENEERLLWAATDNRFFAVVLRPAEPTKVKVQFEVGKLGQGPDDGLRLSWTCEKLAVPAGKGQSASLDFKNFLGPKRRDLLTGTQYSAVKYDLLISYGGACCVPGVGGDCCGMMCGTSWLAPVMVRLLSWIYFLIPNYGWAIMVLVVIVRVLLHPLTKKSQVSMSKMSKLQPKIDELKKKYEDKPAELNKAMSELYRQEGFSPLLGCLPMLLQMPIWIALWAGLNTSIELRQAPFMLWIRDLATPDALVVWAAPTKGYAVPLLDSILGPVYALNLLPLLLMIAMFFQQLFTPKPTGPQAGQQKFMMWFMTLFFGIMFYNMPSGLTLYVMASTAFGAAEQYVIKKHIKEKDEAEKAAAGGDAASPTPRKELPPVRPPSSANKRRRGRR